MCPGKDVKSMIEFGKDRPFNDVRYYLNFNKLLALGWKPEMTFKEGLKQTVAWYMEREANWWECGTDSSLAAHPHAKVRVRVRVRASSPRTRTPRGRVRVVVS